MQGQQNVMNFIDVNFRSSKLAEKITKASKNAMLHYIYNRKMAAILVNNMVAKQGSFTLQVVNY